MAGFHEGFSCRFYLISTEFNAILIDFGLISRLINRFFYFMKFKCNLVEFHAILVDISVI